LAISGKNSGLSGNSTYQVTGLVVGPNSSFPGRSAGVGLNEARFTAGVSRVQALSAESLPFADGGRGGVEDKAGPFINGHPGLWVHRQGKLER
jgi:hypothetical protein